MGRLASPPFGQCKVLTLLGSTGTATPTALCFLCLLHCAAFALPACSRQFSSKSTMPSSQHLREGTSKIYKYGWWNPSCLCACRLSVVDISICTFFMIQIFKPCTFSHLQKNSSLCMACILTHALHLLSALQEENCCRKKRRGLSPSRLSNLPTPTHYLHSLSH